MGGVLPYMSYILGMTLCAAPSGRVLRRFGLKTGIHFAHFDLESARVRANLSFQFQMSKKEREICEFEMDLKNLFVCLRSILSNDNIISG